MAAVCARWSRCVGFTSDGMLREGAKFEEGKAYAGGSARMVERCFGEVVNRDHGRGKCLSDEQAWRQLPIASLMFLLVHGPFHRKTRATPT